MNDREDRNYQQYISMHERERNQYFADILDREQKAYDYGVLVVKNATLIAGGGLLSIPAIIGLAGSVSIDPDEAVAAALWFSGALLSTILAAYLIHINWLLHASAHQKWWSDRQDYLAAVYLEPDNKGNRKPFKHQDYHKFGIGVTFWIPHALAGFYVFAVILGFHNLYQAFGLA